MPDWFAQHADWPEAVLPDYGGGSVANVTASVMSAFGALDRQADLLPALRSSILPPDILVGARVVVVIVLDGLSASAYDRAVADKRMQALRSLSVQTSLTSVFPSTTTAALTSLQVGAAPARHGVVGYTMYLASVDRVVNMISFKPVDGGAFRRPAPDPMRFLPVPRVYERLAASGVECVVVSHALYADSPLTRLQCGDVRYVGHRTPAEFAWLLRREVARPGRRFVFGYWAGLDILGHRTGPSAPICDLEREIIDRALGAGFFEQLAVSGDDVTVLVTSDHGQIDLDPERVMLVGTMRAAGGGWRHPPTGERRATGLSLKHADGRTRLAALVGDSGTVLETRAALNAGLYGPPPFHAGVVERIGDLLVLAKGGVSFPVRLSPDVDALMLGSHGSLTPQEMLVPLLAQRFGG